MAQRPREVRLNGRAGKRGLVVLGTAIPILALVFATVGGTVGLAAWRGAKAERAAPQRGEIVTGADGSALNIETYGAKDAPPLVIIHGASGSTYDMTFALVPALTAQFRIYVVDRPGFGHSPALPAKAGDDTSLRAQARAIRAAVFAVDPRPPLVLGQSYGGAVALAMALDTQESLAGLVLVSAPSHVWDGSPPALYRLLTAPVVGPMAAWAIAAFTPASVISHELDGVFDPQDEPAGYEAHFQPEMSLRPSTLLLNARQRVALKAQLARMSLRYPDLTLPIESLHGTADTTVPPDIHAERLALEASGNVLALLDGIGHMPHHVAIDDVTRAVHRAQNRISLP